MFNDAIIILYYICLNLLAKFNIICARFRFVELNALCLASLDEDRVLFFMCTVAISSIAVNRTNDRHGN